jgi:hypothetical protein
MEASLLPFRLQTWTAEKCKILQALNILSFRQFCEKLSDDVAAIIGMSYFGPK